MDQEAWEVIGHFSRYRILASGEKRRLQDPDTGKIIREYTVPVYRHDPEGSGDSQQNTKPSSEYAHRPKDEV